MKLVLNLYFLFSFDRLFYLYYLDLFRTHIFWHFSTDICSCLINSYRPDPGQREKKEKINLNFYFHLPLWCFERFYDGLAAFKNVEIVKVKVWKYKFKLIFILIRFAEIHGGVGGGGEG